MDLIGRNVGIAAPGQGQGCVICEQEDLDAKRFPTRDDTTCYRLGFWAECGGDESYICAAHLMDIFGRLMQLEAAREGQGGISKQAAS